MPLQSLHCWQASLCSCSISTRPAGQSNANGRGDAAQLSAPLNAPQTDERFKWHRTQSVPNAGHLTENAWTDLASGSGHGTTSPVYPREFGSELSFGRAMAGADSGNPANLFKHMTRHLLLASLRLAIHVTNDSPAPPAACLPIAASFDGLLDEPAITNDFLAPTELQALATEPVPAPFRIQPIALESNASVKNNFFGFHGRFLSGAGKGLTAMPPQSAQDRTPGVKRLWQRGQ